jgi:outer membrane protein OmpA-like peptidoglycan-associated protein
MKKKFFALVGIFLAFIVEAAPANTRTRHQADVEPTNYVVIGAFSVKRNAVKFASRANNGYADQLKITAQFELNANRKLYYVYAMTTNDHEAAIREATRLRSETKFADAWVYSGIFEKSPAGKEHLNVDINPETKQKIKEIKQDQYIEPKQEVTQEEKTIAQPVVEQPPVETPKQEETKTAPANSYVEVPTDEGNEKKFVFKLYRATDSEQVEGEVNVVDEQSSKKIGTYKGNIGVKVTMPTTSSKELGFTSEVFGYRKVTREFNFADRMPEDVTLDQDKNIVVPFELARMQKGDISIMYNVYFFKDAAIMRPESRYEVNSLLDMMKENPKYKIRIHGHTNGSAAGKIIEMAEGSKNFFSLTNTKDGGGSAKKLSEERGNVIKAYLVENGITPERMEVKAWGGKKPIHDKHSNRAQENVRVEIEILED